MLLFGVVVFFFFPLFSVASLWFDQEEEIFWVEKSGVLLEFKYILHKHFGVMSFFPWSSSNVLFQILSAYTSGPIVESRCYLRVIVWTYYFSYIS